MENVNNKNEYNLYKKRRKFRFFKGINSESSRKIDEQMRVFADNKKVLYSSFMKPHGERHESAYITALIFLDNNFYLTYDEKIAFLIRLFDPFLKMYQYYKELSGNKDEVKISNHRLMGISKNQEAELKERIKSEFGFYEPLLIRYESVYSKSVLNSNKEDMVTMVKNDYTSPVTSAIDLNSISLLTDYDELDEVLKEARLYLKANPKPSLNDLLFNLIYESADLDHESLKTKLLFIMFVMDNELRYASIYEQNYHLLRIKNTILREFGYYCEFLMDLEHKFIKDNAEERVPAKKVSNSH